MSRVGFTYEVPEEDAEQLKEQLNKYGPLFLEIVKQIDWEVLEKALYSEKEYAYDRTFMAWGKRVDKQHTLIWEINRLQKKMDKEYETIVANSDDGSAE